MATLAEFTPGEAARISGVSATLQRDWRRRGYLRKEAGQARFTSFDVAELMALNALAARSIGPQQATMVAKPCAVGILHAALSSWSPEGARAAWDGDFENAVSWELEATDWGLPSGEPVHEDWLLSRRAHLLADRALKKIGQEDGAGKRAFFWWADGSVGFFGSAINALEQVDGDRLCGAVILVDNDALGRRLRQKAGRPLAVVEDYDCAQTKAELEEYRRDAAAR